MKKIHLFFLTAFFLAACNSGKDIPDVSKIKVHVPIERFDQAFFSIDTQQLLPDLGRLEQQFPDFYTDFMREILGVDGKDEASLQVIRDFLSGYRPVYDSVTLKYKNLDWLQRELEQAFRYVKYYFPDYDPGKAITFIGPFDAPGTALTRNGLAIGLHQYAGKNFTVYQSIVGQQLFPLYISRRFDKEYITANCMKAVIEDLFPDRSVGKGLIEQMIEKGKQWWLLDYFMPEAADSVKTGYTQHQLDWCREYEGLIWQTIITNEKDLFTTEPVAVQTYIGEGPFTQGMPEVSPGNIGQWVGWQIVKLYAEKNPDLKIGELMLTPPRKILEDAKYKPK